MKILYMCGLLFLISVMFSAPLQAQYTEFTEVSSCLISSDYASIMCQGDYAYAATRYGFKIFDVSDPANPLEVVHEPTTGICVNVTAYGDFAFVCDSKEGLILYDISNINNPQIMDVFNPPGVLRQVCPYNEQYVFVTAEDYGINIIDYSDPGNMIQANFVFTGGEATEALIYDDLLYVTIGIAGLEIYDVSDPVNPDYQFLWNTVGGKSTGIYLYPDGNTLVIADWDNGFHLLDLTFPWIPTWVATVQDSDYIAIDVTGESEYSIGSYASQGLVSFDADGDSLGFLNTGNYSYIICANNGYTYVCRGDSGLKIVDTSDPQNMLETGNIFEYSRPRIIAKLDNYLYVTAKGGGLYVIDVSDPNYPEVLNNITTTGWTYYMAFTTDEQNMFVSDYYNGIDSYDISDKANPILIGNIATVPDTGAHSLIFRDGYLYASVYNSGLNIFDASDPSSLTLEYSSEDTISGIREIAISEDGTNLYACCGGFTRAVQVYTIEEPDSLIFEYTIYDLFDDPRHMSISGNYGYVSDGDNGLYVIDITNSAYIFLVDSVMTNDYSIYTSFVDDDHLLMSEWSAGIALLDISDPYNVTIIDRYNTPGYVEGTVADGNIVYAGDYFDLQILSLTGNGVSPAEETPGLTVSIARLFPAFPNPFNSSATITFDLYRPGKVDLQVVNVAGETVQVLHNSYTGAGNYRYSFDGTGLATGIYFARLQTEGYTSAQKILLVK